MRSDLDNKEIEIQEDCKIQEPEPHSETCNIQEPATCNIQEPEPHSEACNTQEPATCNIQDLPLEPPPTVNMVTDTESHPSSSSSSFGLSLKSIFCGVLTPKAHFSRRYSYYCLGMFCLINLLDQADRWALPTLQSSGLQCSSCGSPSSNFYEKCRAECLNISDVDMGLLTGPTFSVTALLCTIPFGWMADRLNRVIMLWLGLIVWSVATLASAFTHQFWELVLCRCLLGVGQAVVNPCVFSITSDLFSEDRAFFLSFFTSMIYTGQAFGLGCGALAQVTSWRWAFLILGIPGIALSIPFIFTVREPVRGMSEKTPETEEEKIKISNRQTEEEEEKTVKEKLGEVAEQVWFIMSYPPFTALWIAGLLRFMAGYAIGGWIQVFYRRVHGIEPSKLALWLAIIIPSAGLSAAYTGGYISDWWHKRDPSGKAWLCVISSLVGSVFMSAVLLVPSLQLSLILLWFEYFTAEMWYAPAGSIALDVSPPAMRSFATACYLACGAFGAASSVIVGALNSVFDQQLETDTEDDEIVYDPTAALLIMTSGMYVLSAFCFIALAYLLRIYEARTAVRIEEN